VARSPEGIVRVTRHPFLVGVGLWAVVHLIANGDVASFIFFGALAVTALAGTVSIDAKRRRALGRGWQSFAAQTSIVPFAAIASGRTRFNPGEIAASQWVAALIAYALMLGGHSHIIGVSPFPSLRPASDEITKDLSLSEIKFEHTDGVIRRELVSGKCARWPEQPTVQAHPYPKVDVFGRCCKTDRGRCSSVCIPSRS
jgi:NnrU protein